MYIKYMYIYICTHMHMCIYMYIYICTSFVLWTEEPGRLLSMGVAQSWTRLK